MKSKHFILVLILIFPFSIFGQGELEADDGIFINNEKSLGIYLNSNGFGADFRYAKRLDGFRKRVYEIGVCNIKHPKEIRSHNPYYEGESYVFGKLNYFFPLRTGIGRQKEIFSKFDKGSISIRYILSGGLSTGILKPIYYEVLYPVEATNRHYVVNEKFDPLKHHNTYAIYGKAPFSEGLNETKIIPGIYIRFAFNFEYAKVPRMINALEAGFISEAYYKKVPIMATDETSRYFLTLFVSYRFGKLFSPRIKEEKLDLNDLRSKDE